MRYTLRLLKMNLYYFNNTFRLQFAVTVNVPRKFKYYDEVFHYAFIIVGNISNDYR